MSKRDDIILDADAQTTKTPYNLDKSETTVFKEAVEYTKTKTYDIKYKNLRALSILPVSTEAPAGADFIVWYSYGKAGMAKIIQDYAHDFPRVDVYAVKNQTPLFDTGDAYGYSIKEIRRAALTGSMLDQRRANTARRAMDELFDNLAWFGDEDYNIQGFFGLPGIGVYTVPNGASGDTEWTTKTPDEIILDLTGILDTVSIPTNGREIADTIFLPRLRYNLIKNKRMGTSSDSTVLTFFLGNNPGVKIEAIDELKDQGVADSQRMIAFTNDMDHISLEIPSPFEQLDVQKKGATWEIPCIATFGGIILYYPQSMAQGDGI